MQKGRGDKEGKGDGEAIAKTRIEQCSAVVVFVLVCVPNEFDYECVMFWLANATKVARGYQQLRNESIKRY